MLKKILLPTDFSISSKGPMEMAIALAKNFDSEITLLHVIPGVPKSKEVLDMLKKTVRDQFTAIRKKINSSGGKTAEPVIATGNYSDQIIRHAERQDVNLILMGSGKKENTGKFKLSATTAKVIRKSNKPVWVIKREMPSGIKRICCPIDFSEPSRIALNNAIHLAREFRAELTVLNVIAPLTDAPLPPNVRLTFEQQSIAEKETFKFERFLSQFDFHDVKLCREIYQGKPYQEILKRIDVRKSDLLVMGTSGRTGLGRILIGSVTEKVINEIPCSFIILKDENVIRICIETKMHDQEANFAESQQLLSKGFAKEAIRQLRRCLNIDCSFIPAWEVMATAYEKLGHKSKAQDCRNKIKKIRERREQQQVEFDIRRRHHHPFIKG
ncbi:MAG: universal stress protein [Cytophagales bacterium]|nr:universal stress protein [Cytophagales bacterium]